MLFLELVPLLTYSRSNGFCPSVRNLGETNYLWNNASYSSYLYHSLRRCAKHPDSSRLSCHRRYSFLRTNDTCWRHSSRSLENRRKRRSYGSIFGSAIYRSSCRPSHRRFSLRRSRLALAVLDSIDPRSSRLDPDHLHCARNLRSHHPRSTSKEASCLNWRNRPCHRTRSRFETIQ